MIHILLALWMTYIALSVFIKDDFIKIAQTFCFSAVLISSFCILQKVGLDPFGKVAYYTHELVNKRICAFMDNPNLVGNYLILCVPFFFLFLKQKKYILGLVLTSVGIWLADSKVSYIALMVGIMAFILLKIRINRRVTYGLIITFVLMGIVVYQNIILPRLAGGFSDRLLCWQETYKHIKDNPLFGQGIGIFRTFEITIRNSRWVQVHNDWLERILEIGILGIVLFIIVIINSFRRFNYKQENNLGFAYLSSFNIFLVLMCGSFPMEIAPIALIGLIDFWAIEKL